MIVRAVQYIYYLLFHALLRVLIRGKCVASDIGKGRPLLLISNHISRIDPFMLAILPFRQAFSLMPVYFMTSKDYYDKLWLRIIIQPFGAYPVSTVGVSLDDILQTTIAKLREGNTVLIFPEGRIVRKGMRPVLKPGLAHILCKVPVTVVPVKIEGLDRRWWEIILRGGFSIKVGMPKSYDTLQKEGAAKEAENIVNRLRAL